MIAAVTIHVGSMIFGWLSGVWMTLALAAAIAGYDRTTKR